MKTRIPLLLLSLRLTAVADTPPVATTSESTQSPSSSSMHRHILELIQQDAAKTPPKPKEARAPFLNPDASATDQPVAEGVLELEPLQVTKKKTVELPLRVKPVSLDNFFYGDGAIFKNKTDSFLISAGPEKTRAGLVGAIKFTKKF